MKITRYAMMLAAATGLLSACQKLDEVKAYDPDKVVAPVLHALPGEIVITPDNMGSTQTFTWDGADFGVRTQINYSIEASYNDGAKLVLFTGMDGTSSEQTYESLNNILALSVEDGGLGVPSGEPTDVDFYISATIGTDFEKFYSAPVTVRMTVTTAERTYPTVWVIGDYCGWNHGNSQFLFSFSGDEITYVLTDIAEQTRYTVAIVAVDPWGNRSETTVISFGTPANTPPALILESTEEVRVGYNRTETVRYHVSDPDSHGFTCELQDPSGAVAIRKEGDRLCLDIFNYKRTPGNYTAHVSVSDSFGASDTADFDFTLLPDQPPVATGGFRPVYLGSMQETAEFTPSQGFDDEVPGTVAYALEYDEEMLYLQPVASGYRIMPLRYGRSEVTVVATDEGGLAGRDTFAVMCRDDSREVDLYPNPVRDRLSIRMGRDVEGALRVTLYDAAGRRAFAAEVRIAPTAPAVVDLSSLGGGTYTIELRYEGGLLTRSIVKL